MKKLLAALLALILMFTLCSCGESWSHPFEDDSDYYYDDPNVPDMEEYYDEQYDEPIEQQEEIRTY